MLRRRSRKNRKKKEDPSADEEEDPDWGKEHGYITAAAVRALTKWARTALGAAGGPLAESYCSIPDFAYSKPEYRKYVAHWKAGDGLPLHYLPDSDTVERNYDRAFDGFLFYFRNMQSAFARGAMDEGARFAGAIFHFIQDASSQHGMDSPRGFKEPGACSPWPKLLQLFPPQRPDRPNAVTLLNERLRNSRGFQASLRRCAFDGYRPKLLGMNPAEAAFRLYQRYWDVLYHCRMTAPDFFASIYANDKRRLLGTLKARMTASGKVCADILYTALCLGRNKFPAGAARKLREVRVEKLVPLTRPWFTPTPVYYHNTVVVNGNLVANARRRSLALLMPSGNSARIRTFRHGLGTGMGWREPEQSTQTNSCDYAIRYRAPAGVYRWFTVSFGVNPNLPHSGKITLEVHFNGKKRATTGCISKPRPGKTARIDIRTGGAIDLVARHTDPSFPRIIKYPEVHVVWGNPLLTKQE